MSNDASQAKTHKMPSRIEILGVPVDPVTMDITLAAVQEFMREPRLHQIATVNPEFIMTAREDETFREALQAADLCLPDGIGIRLAGKWLDLDIPERVAGSDLVYHLAERAAANGWRLFLLGAAPGVAEEAAAQFEARYPGLQIAGTFAGSPAHADNESIVQRVNESQADMLYVAYGAPNQDKWIARNRQSLKSIRLAIGVGGSLDFVAGRSSRAPLAMQRFGLEWLYRLIIEPWRWRRMLALPRFAFHVIFKGRR